jgi:hypothetical protein
VNGQEVLVFEGLDDIGPEAAVRFGWRSDYETTISLEVHNETIAPFSFVVQKRSKDAILHIALFITRFVRKA